MDSIEGKKGAKNRPKSAGGASRNSIGALPKKKSGNVTGLNLFTLKARHIEGDGKRTTIALEQAFWQLVDARAQAVGQSWQRWTDFALAGRPANIGKARWLRVKLLDKVSI